MTKSPVIKVYEGYLAKLRMLDPNSPCPDQWRVKDEIERIEKHLESLRKKSLTK